MQGIIYSYTNLITKEVYVGATTTSLHRRHMFRKNEYNQWLLNPNDNKLFNSILHHGWNNFEYKIIEEMDLRTKKDLYVAKTSTNSEAEQQQWQDTKKLWGKHFEAADFVDYSIEHIKVLPQLLSGKVDAISLLFPAQSEDPVYLIWWLRHSGY